MKSKLDNKYICTHRMNQDSLENLFLQIRCIGEPGEHPSPLAAIYRIRMIMIKILVFLAQRSILNPRLQMNRVKRILDTSSYWTRPL
jgi:hypothetical protein